MSEGQKKGAPILAMVVIGCIVAAVLFVVNRKNETEAEKAPKASVQKEEKEKGALSDLPLFAPDEEQEQEPEPKVTPGFEDVPQVAEEADSVDSSVSMKATPPQTDRILTGGFVTDLASYMASAYKPAKTRANPGGRAMIAMTFKRLNMRYGVDMTGLNVPSGDVLAARKKAYRHLMSPIVLRLAYGLFSEQFIEELAQAAADQQRDFSKNDGYASRNLQDWHVREMLKLYASMVSDAGNCFKTFASRPDLVAVMNRYFDAVRNVNVAYQQYSDREAVGASQKELDSISKQIQQAIKLREELKGNLLGAVKLRSGALIDETDVLNIASWIYRRLKADPDSINAIGAIASLSQDLARDMRAYHYPPQG